MNNYPDIRVCLNRETRRSLQKEGRKRVPVHSNAPTGTKNLKRLGYAQAVRNFADHVFNVTRI